MKHKNTISYLVFAIAIFAAFAATTGILTKEGLGAFEYESIRGEKVIIYGKGIYKHMSAEVAIQGIAQDYVTLIAGIPLLLISWFFATKGSLKGRFVLAGTLGYFLVTYLFYLVMAMYNPLFPVYAFLLGASFFAFMLTMLSFDVDKIVDIFAEKKSVKFEGRFLIFNAICIAFLWLSIIIPPYFDGSIYPKALEHYTTLIVQGLDLGLLLPLAVVCGVLLLKRKPMGFMTATVYFIFLSLLMTALVAKIIFMGLNGYNIIPVIFIIPLFAFISMICSFRLLRNIRVV
jgi:hypothetical protein